MRSRLSIAVLLPILPCLAAPAAAQHLVPDATFAAIASEFSGELAQESIREIVLHHRIQGSPMMGAVAERIHAKLKASGVEASLDAYPSDGKTLYGTFLSPMGWDMRGGELWVTNANEPGFAPFRLCRYADVPMCVSTYSKGGEWTGELVEVGAGTSERDYASKDVRGKVVLAYGYAGAVIRAAAVARGAVGAVIYPPPDDRPDHPDMVRYNGIWPRADELEKTAGGFQISESQYTRLKGLMGGGPVTVRGKIDATLAPGRLTLVHAYLRGSEERETEVLLTAHLDHPKWSANDNASGSAAMLEIVRVLHGLVQAGRLPRPRRTLHFMWVPEFYGTVAYVAKHPEARRCGEWDDPRGGAAAPKGCVLANLNLDMVGEDTVKTNGRFYFTRTPESVPSFLDAVMDAVLDQTRAANLLAPTGTRNHWTPEMIPYAQGSDHDVFLGLGVPGTMLGHDPDWTHHTSEDTVDKTDATELRRVGVLASAAAYWLASAGAEDWNRLAPRVAADRLAAAASRLSRLPAASSPARAKAAQDLTRRVERSAAALARPAAVSGPEAFLDAPEPPAAGSKGPRRKTILPVQQNALASIAPEDRKWLFAQEDRLGAGPRESLGTTVSLDLAAYEAVNLMDGRRTPADIAAALNVEFGTDLDAAWVERYARILAGAGLVSLP